MRTIIIGDIHGCSLQLMGLLDQLKPNPEEDHLIFLGDLFDRGPDSWGVFQIVKSLAETYQERFTLLRGNHEEKPENISAYKKVHVKNDNFEADCYIEDEFPNRRRWVWIF